MNTAKNKLIDTIGRYNLSANNISKFKFSEKETDLFCQMMTEFAKEYHQEQLHIAVVSNWVTIESDIPPEICTDVMVKYKDGRTEVALFDGDNRFYIEKDDRDVSENIISWHKLPE